MIITMRVMDKMEMSIHEVIVMVVMGDELVAAVLVVDVGGVAGEGGGGVVACDGVGVRDADLVVVDILLWSEKIQKIGKK